MESTKSVPFPPRREVDRLSTVKGMPAVVSSRRASTQPSVGPARCVWKASGVNGKFSESVGPPVTTNTKSSPGKKSIPAPVSSPRPPRVPLCRSSPSGLTAAVKASRPPAHRLPSVSGKPRLSVKPVIYALPSRSTVTSKAWSLPLPPKKFWSRLVVKSPSSRVRKASLPVPGRPLTPPAGKSGGFRPTGHVDAAIRAHVDRESLVVPASSQVGRVLDLGIDDEGVLAIVGIHFKSDSAVIA